MSLFRAGPSKSLSSQTVLDCIHLALEKDVPGLLNVTLVGSAVEDMGHGCSDIDIVMVVDRLDEGVHRKCCQTILKSFETILSGYARRLILNSTFGPLKMYDTETWVIHLMVYDLEGHKQHVEASPFTCLDWERSRRFRGKSLRNLYPVLNLQPGQFLQARRGVQNYLEDLECGFISYRQYEFTPQGYRQISMRQPMDERAQGEYAFHIVKHLLQNYSKLLNQNNAILTEEALGLFWRDNLKELLSFFPWFSDLTRKKPTGQSHPTWKTFVGQSNLSKSFHASLSSGGKIGTANTYLCGTLEQRKMTEGFLVKEQIQELYRFPSPSSQPPRSFMLVLPAEPWKLLPV